MLMLLLVTLVECDCKASALGRCANVAALLLKLSDAEHDKGSTIKPSRHNHAHGIEARIMKKNLSAYMKRNTVQANVNHLLNYICGIQGLKT